MPRKRSPGRRRLSTKVALPTVRLISGSLTKRPASLRAAWIVKYARSERSR